MILAALTPVFAIIALGLLLQRAKLVADSFWASAENLTFKLFFPALLVAETSSARLYESGVAPLLAAVLAGILIVAFLAHIIRIPLALSGPSFTSLMQGAIRPNVYVGLASANALSGGESTGFFAVCLAFAIPLVNILSVLTLLRCAPAASKLSTRALINGMAGNPLILACALGLALNLSGISIPEPARAVLDILGRAALPIGLLAVGAGLRWPPTGTSVYPTIVSAAVLKLLLLPAITLALCHILGVQGNARVVAVLYAGLPCSATAYVMARQMGGDAPLLAGVITTTTVAAVATLPLVIVLAG